MVAADGHPVAAGGARASLTAAVVASEPFFANFTISAVGTVARKRSAASTSTMDGRTKLHAAVELPPRRLDHARVGVAEADRPQAGAVLDERLPSTSHTWAPRP